MVKIGMLRQFKVPNNLVTAAALAAMAQGDEFFFFNPSDVDFEKRLILGRFYINGKWVRKITTFPDVIDNSPSRKENKAVYKKLSKMVPFTTRRIGNKNVIYERLLKEEIYKYLLIPSLEVNSIDDIKVYLNEFKKIVLKPIGGNQGKGICYIELNNGNFIISFNKTQFSYTEGELLKFLKELVQKKYIVQKYIQSVTKDGLPYDIRVHVRRGSDGEWKTVKIYPRIGTSDGIISNLSQGGSIAKIKPFLKRQFGEELALKIESELKILAKEFPIYFQKGYSYPIDALGLDIGLDENGKMYLFEVNSFPGSTFFELDAQIHAMGYARYIANKVNKDLNFRTQILSDIP